uniref:Uncharacterized protein n=1 Tax=Plectus sambesii TaxID=2011161 RepID=A0A914V183_9BILA
MLRYWPPGSLAMRMHWLLVLTEVDFYVAGNPSQQLRVLVEHFHAKFANLIAALGSSRLSIIQMVMLVELFELDLANHAVLADPSSASNKLDAIPFVLYAVVGASASSGAFFTTHLKRIFDISALMSRTEDATVRQLCGRLLAACFEAQRLVQEGCVRLTDVKSVPVDLRRNVEDLSTKFVDDFGVENAAFAFHLPSQWLQQLVFEQMCARLCVSPTATPKWLIKSE